MSIASNFPAIKPSLSLDFANTGALDPRITFTRSTTATYYDGVTTAKAEENLVLYSQEFDNAAWTQTRLTCTANTSTAPDGTSTADTLTENTDPTTSHVIFQQPSLVANAAYTLSCYAKAGTRTFINLCVRGASSSQYASAIFNLSTGALTSSGATGTGWSVSATSITEFPAGSGWYRCVLSLVAGTTVSAPLAAVAMSDGTSVDSSGLSPYTGNGSTLLVWGAQLEQRSSVTAYTPTTSQPITNYIPVLQTAAANVARFDHNPTTGESLGLLIEESRTNLLTYSEQFDNAAWTKSNSSVTANSATSPDGTNTADKLVEDTNTNVHLAYQSFTSTAQAYTWSCYVKAAERTQCFIRAQDASLLYAYFDLSSGAVVSAAAGLTASIQNVGNGWYRCIVTRTIGAGTSYFVIGTAVGGTASYTGDGYSGIFIWGAQLEAGAFPTSYIQTVASQVTRAADAASMTGTNFSSWFNAGEGTLFMNGTAATVGYSLSINDNSASNAITLVTGTSGSAFWVDVGGSSQAAIGTRSLAYVYAGAYKVNDFAVSVNGAAVATDTVGVLPTNVSQMNIGTRAGASGPINGTIKKIAYYQQRLTDAQLQALTS